VAGRSWSSWRRRTCASWRPNDASRPGPLRQDGVRTGAQDAVQLAAGYGALAAGSAGAGVPGEGIQRAPGVGELIHTAGPGVGAKPPPTIAYPAMAGYAQARGTARLSAPPRCGSRRWQWRIWVRAGDRRRPALASIPGLPSRSMWKGAANTNCCKSSRPPEYPAVSSPATSCDGHVQNAPFCAVIADCRPAPMARRMVVMARGSPGAGSAAGTPSPVMDPGR